MTPDVTWQMTLPLIFISLELFSLRNTPQVNACRGTYFLFFRSLLGKAVGFSAVTARFPAQLAERRGWPRPLLQAVPAPPAAITPLPSVSLLQTRPARPPLSVRLGHH